MQINNNPIQNKNIYKLGIVQFFVLYTKNQQDKLNNLLDCIRDYMFQQDIKTFEEKQKTDRYIQVDTHGKLHYLQSSKFRSGKQ